MTPSPTARLVDALLEASVVGSFTRIGYQLRRRLFHWVPLSSLRLEGKVAIVTGATSGPGRVAAELMARQGAELCTQALDVDKLDPSAASYDGTAAYSRCKRAQVVLAEEWTRRLIGSLPASPSTPCTQAGWADSPGLRDALPGFRKSLGLLVRTPLEGADTIVWLAAAPEAAGRSGLFFLDRRPRATHRLRRTRRADGAVEAARRWQLCVDRTSAG